MTLSVKQHLSWGLLAAVATVAALLQLVGAAPAMASTASVSLGVSGWDVDGDTHHTAYHVSVSGSAGSACYSSCTWSVQGGEFVDGAFVSRVTLASNTFQTNEESSTFSGSREGTFGTSSAITHVRARVTNSGGEVGLSGAQQVNTYRTASTELDVRAWDVDPVNGDITYDVAATAKDLRGPGQICYGTTCKLYIEVTELVDGVPAYTNRLVSIPGTASWNWSSAWSLSGERSQSGWSYPHPVTHIRAVVVDRNNGNELSTGGWFEILTEEDRAHLMGLGAGMPVLAAAAIVTQQMCDEFLFMPNEYRGLTSVPERYNQCVALIGGSTAGLLALADGVRIMEDAQHFANSIASFAIRAIEWQPRQDEDGDLVGFTPPGYYNPEDDDRILHDEIVPEPAAAGAGVIIPPRPPDCPAHYAFWDERASNKDVHTHHIIPYGGVRGSRYQERLDDAKLSDSNPLLLDLSLQHDAWNKVRIPHAGAHPVKYHDWISLNLDRLIEYVTEGTSVSEQAERLGDVASHLKYIVQRDPFVVRGVHWNCL